MFNLWAFFQNQLILCCFLLLFPIAIRLEAIATRLEAIAIRLEAIASRLEAIPIRLEAIAIRLEAEVFVKRKGVVLSDLGQKERKGRLRCSLYLNK